MKTYYGAVPVDSKWRRKVEPNEIRALERAWTNNGVVTNSDVHPSTRSNLLISLRNSGRTEAWNISADGLRIKPFSRCGSRLLAAPSIREMRGYVCTDCRYDSAGVRWPPEFDTALKPLPPHGRATTVHESGQAREAFARRSRQYTPLEELPEDERAQLVRRYTENDETLRPLARDFNISFDAARKLVADAGVQRRRGRRAKTD